MEVFIKIYQIPLNLPFPKGEISTCSNLLNGYSISGVNFIFFAVLKPTTPIL